MKRKYCLYCKKLLSQRINEWPYRFAARKYCNHKHSLLDRVGKHLPGTFGTPNNRGHLGYTHSQKTKDKISINRRGKCTGQNHHHWNNGSSFLPYGLSWTKELRESIRKRDDYRCTICGARQSKRKHVVHHIDGDKENCNPMNLVTLCIQCHLATHRKKT